MLHSIHYACNTSLSHSIASLLQDYNEQRIGTMLQQHGVRSIAIHLKRETLLLKQEANDLIVLYQQEAEANTTTIMTITMHHSHHTLLIE